MRLLSTKRVTSRRWRTPSAALAVVIVFSVALTGVSGWLVDRGRDDAIVDGETRAVAAAQVVSAHVQWLFEASFQALRRIDEGLGQRPSLSVAGLDGDLAAEVEGLPGGVRIVVFDAAGRALLSNDPAAVPDRSSVTDPVMSALAAGGSWHVEPFWFNAATGRAEFAIARGLWRDGRFAGVALIAVPVDLMSGFWSSLELGPDSSVGLIRDDGWLIARHPVPTAAMDLGDHVLFTDHLPAAPAGAYDSSGSPVDGVGRIVGYTRVAGLPLVAVAGLSRDAVLGAYWIGVAEAGVVIIPVALALLLSWLWLLRLLRREEAQRAELARALEQNDTLLREIHHRVKNNLQTVLALVQMHPAPPELREELGRRIAAMAKLHEHVYSADRLGSIDLGAYLRALVGELSSSHGDRIAVHLDLAPLDLESGQALPIGLVATEVIGNALKHGFPGGRQGNVHVRLAREVDGLRLQIHDDGVGYDTTLDRRGMGSRLIDALARRTGATSRMDSGPAGTGFELWLPLDAGTP